MLKKSPITSVLLFSAFGLAAGCAPSPAPVQPTQSPISITPRAPGADASPVAHDMGDTAPVKDAVAHTIERYGSLFPKGTQLESVAVRDSIAVLDFNAAFSGLANMGDSTESGAQKRLRATLAKFPEIQKMRITVAGKPFDSQATDWTTPFPVRETEEEKQEEKQEEKPNGVSSTGVEGPASARARSGHGSAQ